MTAADRFETKRISCECGNGEFAFFTCQLDGWSFINNPTEEWYEMHIFCEQCVSLFKDYKPTHFSTSGEADRWKIRISNSEKIPEH